MGGGAGIASAAQGRSIGHLETFRQLTLVFTFVMEAQLDLKRTKRKKAGREAGTKGGRKE